MKNLNNQPNQNELNEIENLFNSNELDILEKKTRKLIDKYPKTSVLYNILGVVFQKKNNFDEAILNLKKAINLQPNFDQAHNNLGNILKNTGKFEEAVNSYREALKINPNYAEAYSNLGNALTEVGKIEEAIANHQKALKLNPKYKIANVNESIARLTLGEFEIGWKKYEARIGKNNITPMRHPIEKIWDGNYLNGILLVWAEQGLGDHIIFASMLIDLKKYAKKIILQIDKRLENLLIRYFTKINFSNIKIVKSEKELIFDKHIAMGSLGQYLRKSKKLCKKYTSTN